MSLVICFICAISLMGSYSLILSRWKLKDVLILLATIILGEFIYSYIPFKIYASNMVLINVLFINIFVAVIISVVYFKDIFKVKKLVLAISAISFLNSFIFYLMELISLSVNMPMLSINTKSFLSLTLYTLYISFVAIIGNKYIKISGYNLDILLKNHLLYWGIAFTFMFNISIQVIINFILGNPSISLSNILLMISECISVVSFGMISIFIHLQKKYEDMLHRQLEINKLKEYTENIELLNKDIRTFRHDFINIMSSLKGYFDIGDLEGVQEFFYKNLFPLTDTIGTSSVKLHLLENIKILEIKGLLSSKIIRAKVEGIDIFVDISEVIDFIDIDTIDLCRVLGILLDNAIEAAKSCEVPTVKLGVIKKKRSVLFVIINSFTGQTPKVYEIYKAGFSTKGQNRGIGLATMKNILSNYFNTVLDTTIENDTFTQTLEIIDSTKGAERK